MILNNEVEEELKEAIFRFFYYFSRFEFALKENGILRTSLVGTPAEPGWNDFIQQFEDFYQLTASANQLINLNPKKQYVGEHGNFSWKPVDNFDSDLDKVVRLLKIVRNNLFHGGKHGAEGWDDPNRIRQLVSAGLAVLDELAQLSNLESDYKGLY